MQKEGALLLSRQYWTVQHSQRRRKRGFYPSTCCAVLGGFGQFSLPYWTGLWVPGISVILAQHPRSALFASEGAEHLDIW